jgi:tetratricopeptide (TPR) repeat protein
LADEVDRRLKDFAERYPDNVAINYYYALSLWDQGGGQEGNGLDKIEGLLHKAASRAPEWYEAHFQLGILLESEKHYSDAIRELRKAARLEPALSPAHFHLAVLYKRIGDQVAAAREGALVRQIKDKDREADTAPLITR